MRVRRGRHASKDAITAALQAARFTIKEIRNVMSEKEGRKQTGTSTKGTDVKDTKLEGARQLPFAFFAEWQGRIVFIPNEHLRVEE